MLGANHIHERLAILGKTPTFEGSADYDKVDFAQRSHQFCASPRREQRLLRVPNDYDQRFSPLSFRDLAGLCRQKRIESALHDVEVGDRDGLHNFKTCIHSPFISTVPAQFQQPGQPERESCSDGRSGIRAAGRGSILQARGLPGNGVRWDPW